MPTFMGDELRQSDDILFTQYVGQAANGKPVLPIPPPKKGESKQDITKRV
jgi:hypothetical protein